MVNDGSLDTTGKYFLQTADINWTDADDTFSGIGVYKNNGGSTAAFKGVYDGDNKTISNITIAPAKYQGLFAQVEGGTVKNLTVDTVTFDWEANYETKVTSTTDNNKNPPVTTYATEFVEEVGGAMCVGCLVDGTVENVTTKGSFGSAGAPLTASAGGVVNRICAVAKAVNIMSCTNEAAMYTAGAKAAGVVIIYQKSAGQTGTVTLTDCVNKGAINFVDKGFRMVVKETGVATDKCDTAGGYAGVIAHTVAITINNCSNEGTITVAEKAITDGACIGQIVGHTRGSVTATGCSGLTTTLAYGNDTDNYKAVGLDFATVANDVATYVVPAAGSSYLVTSELAAFELAGADATITLDTNLATATVTTQVAGYQVKQEADQGDAKVITYSLELIPVTGVTLDKATLTMNLGDVSNLVATVAPDTVLDNKVVWSVVEGDAVTVEAGAVTAIKAGTATVKAEANADSTKFATCVVTVTAPAPADWPEDPSTVKGKTAAEVFGLTGDIATADAADVASWAKGNGKVNFADKAAINVKAMLLNVENTDDTSSAEADFKFSAEDLAALMKGGDDAEAVKAAFEAKYPYAAVEVKNSNVLPLDSAKAADGNAGFYQAVLSVKAAPVKEN